MDRRTALRRSGAGLLGFGALGLFRKVGQAAEPARTPTPARALAPAAEPVVKVEREIIRDTKIQEHLPDYVYAVHEFAINPTAAMAYQPGWSMECFESREAAQEYADRIERGAWRNLNDLSEVVADLSEATPMNWTQVRNRLIEIQPRYAEVLDLPLQESDYRYYSNYVPMFSVLFDLTDEQLDKVRGVFPFVQFTTVRRMPLVTKRVAQSA